MSTLDDRSPSNRVKNHGAGLLLSRDPPAAAGVSSTCMEGRAETEGRLYDALAAAMPRARSMAHLWLCAMFHVARRLPEARRHAESALSLATEIGDGASQALATAHLAALAAAAGDVEHARVLFHAARTHARCN